MHVRCPYCRHSFTLSRDYLVDAVAKAEEKRQKYHTVECANCRKAIKVPVVQMKRYLPRERPESEESEESAAAES